MNSSDISKLKQILNYENPFEKLQEDLNILSKFVVTYNDYMQSARDYGTGDFLSMQEAHILSNIVDEPGINVTTIAKLWNRTPSAISQTVRKLLDKNYIYRVNSEDNGKVFMLYPTTHGLTFDKAHKTYDERGTIRVRMELLETFSQNEIDIFYKVMKKYTDLINKE